MNTLTRQAQLIRRRIFLQLADSDPIVGTVFGALVISVAILAIMGR